jgi:hypothetical protein
VVENRQADDEAGSTSVLPGGPSAPHSSSYAICNLSYGYLESSPITVGGVQSYTLSAWVRGELDADGSMGAWAVRVNCYNSSNTYLR